jgi:1-hydroxycarotenoid 3,4-desaturase
MDRVNNSGMYDVDPNARPERRVIVVGAGMGGLATALRLRARGFHVTLLDSHPWVGGKMRTVPSGAGPVDAGPTVLTMKPVFDDLFASTGALLDDQVTLIEEPLLARHFWPDGSTLDLTSNRDQNIAAIENFSNAKSASEFAAFSNKTRELFEMFEAPMMQTAEPRVSQLAKGVLRSPQHLATVSPFATLASLLRRQFSDPRLRQLFGRYATYVGGSPTHAPALLALIWQAEANGVWRVSGGMHHLAEALADRFQAIGGRMRLNTPVDEIMIGSNGVDGVRLKTGETLDAECVVYCGDPRALANGHLGGSVSGVAAKTRTAPRSLSARVWSFAAQVEPPLPLAHHNVFFAQDPTAEFEDLAGGAIPTDPTIYICAEDRGTFQSVPSGAERFEIILNAPPLTDAFAGHNEEEICRQTTFQTLKRFGLTFDPLPADNALSTPTTYNTLFPASAGSLYGQSPHGMTAALKRPRARTAINGLYLAGGGTHPGAGVPMAALSGKHAAEAIMRDHALT